MIRKLTGVLCLSVMCAVSLSVQPVLAADWPNRPISLIQPFGAGGVTDRIARVLADHLSKELGATVVVETRPGAGGSIGSAQVARAAPDGYTLLVSGLASQVTSPLVRGDKSLDVIKDFTHIAYIGGPPIAWVAAPSTGFKSVADIVNAAKAGKVTSFATPGVGTLGHKVAEHVALKAGIKLDAVPYNTQTLADVITGRIPFASTAWATALGQIQANKLSAVGVTSAARLKAAPDLPTFKQQGYDLAASTWASLSGPAGLPPEIVKRLHELVGKFLMNPDAIKPVSQDILEIEMMTPEQLTARFKQEIENWTPVVESFRAKQK